jgi:hypothetical protein
MRTASRRAADARPGAACPAAPARASDGSRGALQGGHCRQRAGPAVRGERAQPEVGGRLHLYLDGRRLALCRCRHRSVFAARGRLVDAGHDGGATGDRRVAHGDLAARTSRRPAASFRSRQPLHQRAIPAAHGGARRSVQHEPVRQCLGQRHDGELLLDPENRADRAKGLSHAGSGPR